MLLRVLHIKVGLVDILLHVSGTGDLIQSSQANGLFGTLLKFGGTHTFGLRELFGGAA